MLTGSSMRRALFVSCLLVGCSESGAVGLGPPNPSGAPDAGDPTPDGGSAPSCDDGDPCSDDRWVAGACVHEPVAEGSACDDGDPCTHADVCREGICRGAAGAEGPPRVLSIARPRFRSAGRAVGRDRFLFATREGPGAGRTFVVLTRADADGFDVLDEQELSEPPRDFISLAPDLAAVLTPSGAQLVDLSGDRLVLRGRVTTGAPPTSGAFGGGRFFLCVASDWLSSDLFEFDATDLDAPRALGTNPDAAGCLTVTAASLDRGAYATTFPSRLVRLTPRPSGISTVEVLSASAEAVHSHAGFLTLATGGAGVRLVRERDLAEVGAVRAAWVRSARHTSRGLEIYVQETDTLELVVYEVDVGGSPSLRSISRETVSVGTSITGQAGGWGSHNDGLRIFERNQVFVLDDAPPFLREIQDPDSSWPGSLYVQGTDVFLRDAHRAVRIDASDPAAPRSIAGGLHGGSRSAVALEFDGARAVGLFGDQFRRGVLGVVDDVDTFRVESFPEAPLVARRMGLGQRAVDFATHDLGFSEVVGRRDRLSLVGESVYRLQRPREGARQARLDRWWATDFLAAPRPPPVETRIIRSPSGDRLDVFARRHDDAALAFSTRPEDGGSAIYWSPLAGPSDPIGPFKVPWEVVDLASHGDRVFALGVDRVANVDRVVFLLSLERSGDELRALGARSWAPSQTIVGGRRILGFDGQFVYLNFLDGSPERAGNALIGLRVTDLEGALADYPLPDAPVADAFEVAPWGLVLAADETLVIAEPWCDTPSPPTDLQAKSWRAFE